MARYEEREETKILPHVEEVTPAPGPEGEEEGAQFGDDAGHEDEDEESAEPIARRTRMASRQC